MAASHWRPGAAGQKAVLHLRHALGQVDRGAPVAVARQHVGVQLRDAAPEPRRLRACEQC